MINSHLLYQLSYRGTITFKVLSFGLLLSRFPSSEARHFTDYLLPVNTLFCFYDNTLQISASLLYLH
ncbi:conserved protein of unknown function [Pseudomonas marincola]|uniref:Uncharacterized protein n=1 Tax=Pseudomonas marincola TaxID=437900 RepID=A0A653DZU7_9PSED|nr:conserved protein of unknown function [Pseudomonas marincola]